jgi:hypothetical protein
MGLRSALVKWLSPAPKPAVDERLQQVLGQLRTIQRARYDAAQDTQEFGAYWANADAFDADSANSKIIRHKLIHRSRYELANNGYADGIAQTYATDLVGVGPLLRMQTGSPAFNTMVEREFYLWSKATQFRRKLWCMAHAKHGDGEGVGVMRRNPKVKHRVPLDLVLYEAEQVQTPYLPFDEPGYIDGVKFDEFGNALYYDILREHPGAASTTLALDMTPERVPAEFVLFWFKLRRPGQHRGVPTTSSTLNVGAAARRWREATIAAAETAADFAAILTTQLTPDSTTDPAQAFSEMPINKRMMAAAPMGWDIQQLKAEHPNAQYEALHKQLVNEMARSSNMPFNKAACDSSSYNYASGRLDHQTYYSALDVDREDCNDLVLDPLFDQWFSLAIQRFGWLGGNPEAVGAAARAHLWDWPKHRVADVQAEADSIRTKLESGQTFPNIVFTDAGLDFDDEVAKAATTYGVSEEEIRRRLFDVLLPPPKLAAPPAKPPVAAAANAVLERVNGNGVHHAN